MFVYLSHLCVLAFVTNTALFFLGLTKTKGKKYPKLNKVWFYNLIRLPFGSRVTGCCSFNESDRYTHASLWSRSDLVVKQVEEDQAEPDMNTWSLCAAGVIQPAVTAWSSRGWN